MFGFNKPNKDSTSKTPTMKPRSKYSSLVDDERCTCYRVQRSAGKNAQAMDMNEIDPNCEIHGRNSDYMVGC